MKDIFKEFKPSSWAINNRTSVFILTIIITLAGISAYNTLPKENFPDISLPNVYVSVVYPGTSPKDMENLVVRPIEKQCKGIAGVKKIKSNSLQDYANVVIEFNSDVKIEDAKRKVQEAVDKAKNDLPTDLPSDPDIQEINFADLPIMYVNISGNYDLNKLKRYADDAKDQMESLKEVRKVEVIGALEREIQINVDMLKMQASDISMSDIENAVKYENMSVPGGSIRINDGTRRSLSVSGEFTSVDQLKNMVIKSIHGAPIYLKEIADVKDSFKEQESYARLAHKNVITLSIVKRSGENLIEASDKVVSIVENLQKNSWPSDLQVTLTGDQSEQTRTTLHDLINTIIIGFILVSIILMFFMGTTNAFFVAMSVPLSMFIAFLIMPTIGFTLNMIVLFSFLLALGIVVDDAIVVIENTHRIFNNGKRDIVTAAKMAAGEVFLPVLSGTLTTLAPFIPLAFWKGVIGKFMFFLPITLIITLMASLLVAYIINPVFAVAFMKPHNESDHKPRKGLKITTVIFIALAAIFYVGGNFGMGNFILLVYILNLLNRFWLHGVIIKFQTKVWPSIQNSYQRLLTKALHRPWTMMGGTFTLLIISFVMISVRNGGISFFPTADPNFVFVYTSLPIGTNQAYTDSVTKIVESRVYGALGETNPLVKSVIANVGIGVTDPQDEDQGYYANKSKVSVAFVAFGQREGKSTLIYLDKIRKAVKGIAGAEITVAQEQGGPPVGKPVSIEITGDNINDLIATSKALKVHLDADKIEGVEELRSDLQDNKPQIAFIIDRERANREGISTGQIGNEINMAVLGREVSKYRDVKDDYKIMLRYREDQRNNVDMLKNLKILYRDMSMNGAVRDVPLTAFADVKYNNTYGAIKRKNQKRIVTLSSNVLTGYNENAVVAQVQNAMKDFKAPSGVNIRFAGSQEEQAETGAFLGNALLISLGLIFLILVTQFNSLGKTVIILVEIVFSLIGVLIGFSIFNMEFSIVMTGVGVVALAGIVVRNGILLVEFTDLLKEQGMSTFDAVVEAGRTRMTPVILTAMATISGLIPLAVGFNIDFVTLFTEFNPHIYFGGDSTAFWGPLSWTMIFGLGFATFLTLFMVPVMYLLSDKAKLGLKKISNRNGNGQGGKADVLQTESLSTN